VSMNCVEMAADRVQSWFVGVTASNEDLLFTETGCFLNSSAV
jgi:hypothetical protein